MPCRSVAVHSEYIAIAWYSTALHGYTYSFIACSIGMTEYTEHVKYAKDVKRELQSSQSWAFILFSECMASKARETQTMLGVRNQALRLKFITCTTYTNSMHLLKDVQNDPK